MLAFRVILHANDLSVESHHAFELACGLARDYQARLVMFHVVQTPVVVTGEGMIDPTPPNYVQIAETQFRQLPLPVSNVLAERQIVEGDPGFEIVKRAKEMNADVIVIGTSGRSGVTRWIMGSVAEYVVRHAPCPVMTVSHLANSSFFSE